MKVCYLRDDEEHATAFLRYYVPADYLIKSGWSVKFKGQLTHDENYNLTDKDVLDADLLIMGQFMFRDDLPLIKMFKRHNKKMIFDADDWYLESQMKRVQNDLDAYCEMARMVDGITVASEYLGELYHKKIGIPKDKIYYLPNACLVKVWKAWREKKKDKIAENKKRGLCIGLMGSSNHLPDWKHTAIPVLKEIKKKYPEIRIEVMGLPMNLTNFLLLNKPNMTQSFLDECAESYSELIDLGVVPITPTRKQEEFYPKFVSLGWDIGLATLSNTRTDKSKSFLKYLDFTMAGIVGVYKGISPFTEVIKDGYNGMMANTHQEWVDKLSFLVENNDKRQEILKNATNDVEEKHDFDKEWCKWRDVYRKVITGRSGAK